MPSLGAVWLDAVNSLARLMGLKHANGDLFKEHAAQRAAVRPTPSPVFNLSFNFGIQITMCASV